MSRAEQMHVGAACDVEGAHHHLSVLTSYLLTCLLLYCGTYLPATSRALTTIDLVSVLTSSKAMLEEPPPTLTAGPTEGVPSA